MHCIYRMRAVRRTMLDEVDEVKMQSCPAYEAVHDDVKLQTCPAYEVIHDRKVKVESHNTIKDVAVEDISQAKEKPVPIYFN